MIREYSTDYRSFTGTSDAELGYGPEAVHSRVVDYRAENGQQVGVFATEPHDNTADKTIIMPQSHDYRNEPLSMRRAEIIASRTNSRVALLETPGTVGLIYPAPETPLGYEIYDSIRPLPGARPTADQLKGALRGDFREHAAVQLDAVTDALGLAENDNLILFGESMGAVTATAMAQHIGERGLQLNGLLLHETVNATGNKYPGWLIKLLKNLGGIENDRRNGYFAENAEIGHPIVAFEQTSTLNKRLDDARKRPSQQGIASAANGIGMRVGLEPALLDTLHRFGAKQPEVLLSRGRESTVSDAAEYQALGEALHSRGTRTREWELIDTDEVPMGHSLLMSLGRQATHASRLADYLNGR